MNPQVSVVISTYGRYTEVDSLLESLVSQDCKQELFEVIIVDQNDQIDLLPLIFKFGKKMNLIHYKADFKGLSKAKNIGIKLSKGNIITFSDDDCTFYNDTISSAITYFEQNPTVDVVYGRLYDRLRKKNVMREWSDKEIKLNKFNFHLNYSAVTCFTKLKNIHFDERFGVGAKIGLGEELDYVMQVLNRNLIVKYSPAIHIWHPDLNVNIMPKEKVYNYAFGYGSVFRKNLDIKFIQIYIMSIGYQFLRLFFSLIVLNFTNATKMVLAIKGRIMGFLLFR